MNKLSKFEYNFTLSTCFLFYKNNLVRTQGSDFGLENNRSIVLNNIKITVPA